MAIAKRVPAALGALALAAGAWADADTARRITFTTRSDEARDLVVEAVRRIETYQPGARIQETARKAVELDPEFAWAHYVLGASTFPAAKARPHLDKARELLAKASEGERRYVEAALLGREGRRAEALDAFRKLAADYPADRMVQMMIGQLAAAEGSLEAAQQAYERAIALDGSTPRAYALIGNLHLLRGEHGKARAQLDLALSKASPDSAPGGIFYPRALSHLYEGDVDAALESLRSFLARYKDSGADESFPEVFIWNSMARINLENGRFEEAMRCYEKGFESVPPSSLQENDKKTWLGRLHHGRARTLARMGRHDEAWKQAEVVKTLIDEGGEEGKRFLPAYHYLAGYLKLEAGQAPAAIEHLKQADADDPFQTLLLARAYEKTGDKVSAKQAFAAVLAAKQPNLERALAYPEAKRKLVALEK